MRFPRADRDALVAAVAAIPLGGWAGAHATPVCESLSASAAARVDIAAALSNADWDPPSAVRHLQWAPIGRSRLEAALVGVTDEMLDARPLPGEWSIRQQFAHVELTYERYSIATLYAVTRTDGAPLLPGPDAYPVRRGEPEGVPGDSARAMVDRLRAMWEAAVQPLLMIPADALQRPTEWHTAEHTVGFRLHRFGAHDLELAADVRATASALGVRMTPPLAWAAALVADSGETEAVILGSPANIPAVSDILQQLEESDRRAMSALST